MPIASPSVATWAATSRPIQSEPGGRARNRVRSALMKDRPSAPALASGLGRSADSAARTSGVRSSPATSGRLSRDQTCLRSSLQNPPGLTSRISHSPGSGSLPSGPGSAGRSSGPGTSHSGACQAVVAGDGPGRSRSALARATSLPAAVIDTSSAPTRRPWRTTRAVTWWATIGGNRYMSTVRRARRSSGSTSGCCSTARAARPASSRPWSMSGDQGLRASGTGSSPSPVGTK